jgi:hypothetical protein
MILLRTNYLLFVKEAAHWHKKLAVPLSETFESACGHAVTQCQMNITEADLLAASSFFARNISGTKTYQHSNAPFSRFDKESFVDLMISDEGKKKNTQSTDELIYGEGIYRFNIVQSDLGEIAIPGDFKRLSTLFLYAMHNKGGFVDIHVDKENMTSKMSYSKVTQSAPRPQKSGAPNLKIA